MIDRQDAFKAVGLLVAAFPGFDDRSVELYAAKLGGVDDVEALMDAVDDVIETYDRPGKPPVAVILDAYRAHRRRQVMERPALPADTGQPVHPREGRKIAARAYVRQCERDGREPNWAFFDKIVGAIPDPTD